MEAAGRAFRRVLDSDGRRMPRCLGENSGLRTSSVIGALALACVVAAAAPARAQDEKAVNLVFGLGATYPQAEIKQGFGSGFNFDAGIVFNLKPFLGLQFEYEFNGFGSHQVLLPADPPISVSANHNMQAGLADLLVRLGPQRGRVGVFVIGGPGIYTRKVSLTTPGTGLLPGICNPALLVCFPPVEVPVEDVKGARRTTDFGYNVGVGVDIRPGDAIVIFVEARYQSMRGPEFKLADGTTQQSRGQYVPITIGLRF
jgi:opacity protein-like surface antigen